MGTRVTTGLNGRSISVIPTHMISRRQHRHFSDGLQLDNKELEDEEFGLSMNACDYVDYD